MRRPAKQKAQIIREMTDVFRENGYDGTTLSKLMQRTGLERASLYHYFPGGKAAMAEAVLEDVLEQLSENVLATLTSDDPPDARLTNMLDATSKFYNCGNDLCFVSIFAIGAYSETLSDTLRSAVATWLTSLEATLSEAGRANAKELAHAALSCIQGGLVLSVTQSDPTAFQHSLQYLRSVMSASS